MGLIHANGVEIACEVSGEGPPIVLCHGGEGWRGNFFNLIPLLAAELTVVAYDQRDTGQSSNPPAAYTTADLGRDVGALIAALGWEKASIFGTSFGAMVALAAALEAPGRVDHLILSSAWASRGDGMLPVKPETLAVMQNPDPKATSEKNRLFFGQRFARARPSAPDELMAKATITRSPEERARRSGAVASDRNFWRLGEVEAPTLVVHGSDDRIVNPRYGREIAKGIGEARFELLNGVGHAASLEAPRQVANLILEFVRENQQDGQ